MFVLDHNTQEPLYKQLYKQTRTHVLSGKMSAHAKLPSVRDLAAELSTRRNPLDGAYQELYAEGYIYSKQRSGYFVSAFDHNATHLSPNHEPRNQKIFCNFLKLFQCCAAVINF